MNSHIDIIKGIHPGKLINRELGKKNLSQRSLADQTGIPYQTINAIIVGKRNLTVEQALKIEQVLGYEESFLAILQTYNDIKRWKDEKLADLYTTAPKIRNSLFWDSDFNKINWGKYKKAVIKRVLERGSKKEIKEIIRFYGLSISELQKYEQGYNSQYKLPENIEK